MTLLFEEKIAILARLINFDHFIFFNRTKILIFKVIAESSLQIRASIFIYDQ